jgi:catechol 2,3-dioxygenase-like lactoylglutathione lyase family enzyme
MIDMDPRIHIITLGVNDLARAYRFYHEGLGFPTSRKPEEGIIFFQTGGTCLALYPKDKLAEEFSAELPVSYAHYPSIILAHNTRSKEDVDAFLAQAVAAGGKLEKPAEETFWGGYSGYFSDPDGYLWEVAYADSWKFHPDGSLVIE